MPKADDKEMVQVLFEKEEFELIAKMAELDGQKVAHWVRTATSMRLGLALVDAWDSSSADTPEQQAQRDAAPYGNFRLRCLTPPMGSHFAAEVEWTRNGTGGRVRTGPLSQRVLLGGDFPVFRKFAVGEPAFLYLRGAGFWQIMAIHGRVDGVAVLELQRVGFRASELRDLRSRS